MTELIYLIIMWGITIRCLAQQPIDTHTIYSGSTIIKHIFTADPTVMVVNSSTKHQAITEYKGNWHFISHNVALPTGGEFRRSVCIEHLYYNPDGTIKPILQARKTFSLLIQ